MKNKFIEKFKDLKDSGALERYIGIGILVFAIFGVGGYNLHKNWDIIFDGEEVVKDFPTFEEQYAAVEEKRHADDVKITGGTPIRQNDLVGEREMTDITIVGSDDTEVVNVNETSTEPQEIPTVTETTAPTSTPSKTTKSDTTKTSTTDSKTTSDTSSTSSDSKTSNSNGSTSDTSTSTESNTSSDKATDTSSDTTTSTEDEKEDTTTKDDTSSDKTTTEPTTETPKEDTTTTPPASSDNPFLNPTGTLGGGGARTFNIEENGVPGEGDKF